MSHPAPIFVRKALPVAAALALACGSAGVSAQVKPGEVVRIALIDPISGPMANIGDAFVKMYQLEAERLNTKGNPNNPAGVKFEIVPFDNKMSPQESLSVLKTAIDQGFRYISQGGSSGAAGALIDAVAKHNERNPGKEVVFLNHSAVDPDFTNSKCSYWHFRFDADTSMKMEAMGTAIKDDPSVKKVYIIGQNYSHGHQVAKFAKEVLARKAPSVQVVGEELHPIAQVKDFAPYVAKIKQSGADTVITGNWGNDLALLFKAAKDAGLDVKWYTYYAGAQGTPTAIGNALTDRITYVYGSWVNQPGEFMQIRDAFKKKYNQDISTSTIIHAIRTLAGGIAKAQSTDPVKVAKAMENLTVKSYSGDITMRAADHQLQQPLYLVKWAKLDAKNNYDVEGTGHTFTHLKTFEPYVSSTPTTCQMKRPG
jgi:branched-chain amino acid transport system substrate-binding protein